MAETGVVFLFSDKDAFKYLIEQNTHILSELKEHRRLIMALNTQEQAAAQKIVDGLNTLGTDIDKLAQSGKDAIAAKDQVIAGKDAQIADLTAQLGSAQQANTDLQAKADAAQQQADAAVQDFLTTADSISGTVGGLDQHVQSLVSGGTGGTGTTQPTP